MRLRPTNSIAPGITLVCLTITLLGCGVADAQENNATLALPQSTLTAPPRLALPARDCWKCPGPAPAAPCFDTHRGFLYYGTDPRDDDPYNGFNDCRGGNCGYPGAILSLAWIRKHQSSGKKAVHHRASADCPTCHPVPHYLPSADSEINLLDSGATR